MNKFFHTGQAERFVMLIVAVLIFAGSIIFAIGLSRPQTFATEHTHFAADSTDLAPKSKTHAPPPQTTDLPHTTAPKQIEYSENYVGAPQKPSYTPKEKVPLGTVIDLNAADTTLLQKIPGIGPSFARRIVKYRNLLGGYYTVLQLQEVYGMDPERFQQIKPYFKIETEPYRFHWAELTHQNIPKHPYLNYAQRTALQEWLKKNGTLHSWRQLLQLPQFAHDDSIRLSQYFIFSPDSQPEY